MNENAIPPKAPDLTQARQFLCALDPDPEATFSFRTFDDPGTDKRLATKCYGTIDNGIRQSANPAKNGKPCRPSGLLAFMNNMNAGVFAMVNETDGIGQSEHSVVRVRALFVDCDDDWSLKGVTAFISTSGLLPTIAVASGGITATGADKLQIYWTIKDCLLKQFAPAQLSLIERIGSDGNVHDLPRVMRLPGFWHRKRQPRMTRLLSIDPCQVYDFTSFMATVKRQPVLAPVSATVRSRKRGRRSIGSPTQQSSAINMRMRELVGRHGGLVIPALDALISEAVGPGNGPGNRHETLKTVVGKLGSRAWSADEITAFVLPRVNQQWGDGDWGEHLASVVRWAVSRDLERGIELGKIWSPGSFGDER